MSLEYGKILSHANELQKAIDVLEGITHKINADWRSVYRSFILLEKIYTDLGDSDMANRYKKLFKTSIPFYFDE